jgi:hypothetical protein
LASVDQNERRRASKNGFPRRRQPLIGLSTLNHQPTPGSKLAIDATKKIPGEGFKRTWRAK